MAKRLISFVLAIGLIAGGLGMAVHSADAEWTQDYDCDETFFEPVWHELNNGATDWGDTTHPYIEGDCEVHWDFGGGEGGA